MKPAVLSISEDLTALLHKHGKIRSFAEGKEIFAGGDAALSLPIVLSGSVKMIHFLAPGKEVILDIFGEGEMFAVPPVFDGGKYPSTSIAMEATKLLVIDRKDFLALLRDSSEFSFAVIQWMCAMLREKTATIQNLATSSPEYRVGNILLKLAAKKTGGEPVKIQIRRQDIARMAGLTTETTIRAVRRLADKNLITITHGKIYVEATEPLRRHLAS